MEYNDIKKLIDDMGKSKLSEMEIQFADGTKISLKKNNNPVNLEEKNSNIISEDMSQGELSCPVEGYIVKSPMVGTFYSKPSPSADNFVKVGDKIQKGDKLCIIEAMKLMNEIESEFEGEIVEIFASNEDAVDYGMPLFRIK